MKLYFDDPSFDGQLQRTAAKSPYGCSDLGEVFAIAARITPGDYDSWYREWFAAGESNQDLAEKEAALGHHESARQAYLRASEYFRSAYFFCRRDIDGAPLHEAWGRNREMFRAALPLLQYPTERVQIPFEGIHLEGYVMRPATGDPGPTVLFPSGYDGPVEESYSLGACEAAARGFSTVMFSGPGQAEMLYQRKIPFRPDFEAVVGPVIEFVQGRDDLDAGRLAIVGRSFGGYLAPRAASKEPRIVALAADPAQSDLGAGVQKSLTPELKELFEQNDPAFNDAIWKASPGVAGQEWWLSRAHAHGLSTPLEYAHELVKWVVDVDAISCPTFVSYGEGDFAQFSTKAFYDQLKVSNKRFVIYRDADGGGGHCEGMGPSRYFTDVFGWLQHLWP